MQALGVTTDIWLLQRYLLLSLNQDLIRAQDIGTVVWSVASNENGRHLAWRHIKAYWPNMQSLFGNVSIAMNSLITDVVPYFNTEYDYREVGISYIKSLNRANVSLKLRRDNFRITVSFFFSRTDLGILQTRRSWQRYAHLETELRKD